MYFKVQGWWKNQTVVIDDQEQPKTGEIDIFHGYANISIGVKNSTNSIWRTYFKNLDIKLNHFELKDVEDNILKDATNLIKALATMNI